MFAVFIALLCKCSVECSCTKLPSKFPLIFQLKSPIADGMIRVTDDTCCSAKLFRNFARVFAIIYKLRARGDVTYKTELVVADFRRA